MSKDFMQFNKADLQAAARTLHVEFDEEATKRGIATAIYDAGFTEDDYWKRLGVYEDEYKSDAESDPYADDEEPAEEEVEEQVEEPEEEEVSDDSVAYGRFIGKNISFVSSFGKFSKRDPVFKTTEGKLKEMILARPDKFRRATEKERGLAN